MKRRELLSRSAMLSALGATSTLLPNLARAADAPPTAAVSGNSTMDKVRSSGVMRVGVIADQAPYFVKDLASGKWSGACLSMANDIASILNVKVETVDTTWGNQVLDLETGKIDLAFAVNPTPARSLMVNFTTPMLVHAFTVVTRKGFDAPKTWAELNKPSVRISVDVGSSHETIARHYTPNATIMAFPTRDQAVLAVSTGRADCNLVLAILAIPMLKKNPQLGQLVIPQPVLTLPTNLAVRTETDPRWRNFLSVWNDYNRELGQTRAWLLEAFNTMGITEADIPPQVQF